MRPPHCAGEIATCLPSGSGDGQSFNEAPALRGGNLRECRLRRHRSLRFNEAPALRGGNPSATAKTLPAGTRFNEAPALRGGNRHHRRRAGHRKRGFNEAPALRGGNPPRSRTTCRSRSRFNEAPALRGGNLGRGQPGRRDRDASMRPPHCAGEISRRPRAAPPPPQLQ